MLPIVCLGTKVCPGKHVYTRLGNITFRFLCNCTNQHLVRRPTYLFMFKHPLEGTNDLEIIGKLVRVQS